MSSTPPESDSDSPEEDNGKPDGEPVPKKPRYTDLNRPTIGVRSPKKTYKRVLITGAGKGLGRALALEFASRGLSILGVSRSSDRLNSLLRDLNRSYRLDPPLAHGIEILDVISDADVENFAQGMTGLTVHPDIIVNNAAIINNSRRMWEVPVEEFNQVIDTNVSGIANIMRRFMPWMVDKRHGIIVNISSGWGSSAAGLVSPYCASKWAVEGLTRSLAAEYPNGVIVVALNPGLVDTDMLRSCLGNLAANYQRPETWARRAADWILSLKPVHHGHSFDMSST